MICNRAPDNYPQALLCNLGNLRYPFLLMLAIRAGQAWRWGELPLGTPSIYATDNWSMWVGNAQYMEVQRVRKQVLMALYFMEPAFPIRPLPPLGPCLLRRLPRYLPPPALPSCNSVHCSVPNCSALADMTALQSSWWLDCQLIQCRRCQCYGHKRTPFHGKPGMKTVLTPTLLALALWFRGIGQRV